MEERKMSKLIVVSLVTLLASTSFAADAPKTATTPDTTTAPNTATVPKTVKAKPSKNVVTYQGINNLDAKSKEYYEKAAAEEGVIQSGSGLLYKSLKEGSGASPGVLNTVKVNYRGTLINGREFNSTYKRNMPEQHAMNRVFRCWQDGLLKMKVGGKAKLVCPPEIAFKSNGAAGIVPPGAVVTYEIELLGIK